MSGTATLPAGDRYVLVSADCHAGGSMEQYRECVRLHPQWGQAHFSLGAALAQLGRSKEAIAELEEDRTVEGVYAVARKDKKRTRNGSPYLALELVDASGKIDARVWDDVELLDRRFAEGDAVRILGRVERFGGRLQVQVRSLEAAEGADPAELVPALRRDADELDGFLEFLAAEITHAGLSEVVGAFLGDAELRGGFRALPAAGADGHRVGGTRDRPPLSIARRHADVSRLHERGCSRG